jgi:hypothetical protein
VNWPAGAGRWPSRSTETPPVRLCRTRRLMAAQGTTRDTTMSNQSHWGSDARS